MKKKNILPEIYTFIDFTTHEYYKASRKGEHTYTTHLGGEMPENHPMPYNVYVVVREYLRKHPQEVSNVISILRSELGKTGYSFSNILIEEATYVEKKGLFKKQYPQINVTLEW
ncbi:MAG: hypothetical protein K6C69_01880 [Lachnospiraceae bacterium]|nr:hypothetical protein [Lachnospiraceae bacterium]